MEEQADIQKISKYNSGVAIQIRLDGLWNKANLFFLKGLYEKWNDVLDNIWRELCRDIEKNDFDLIKTEFNKFDIELAKLGKINDNPPEGFAIATKEQIDNRIEQRKILDKKEIYLKRLENSLGKGTKFDEGDDDDFD